MKTLLFTFIFSFFLSVPIFASNKTTANKIQDSYYNTLSKIEDNNLIEIEYEIEKRWEKIKSKNTFEPYSKKSKKQIHKEFSKIKALRNKLWYRNPNNGSPVRNKDYSISDKLIKKGDYKKTSPHLAFDYNCVNNAYNASHILIHGHHFIALESPSTNNLNEFFDLLLDQNTSALIRLKPEREYLSDKRSLYWKLCSFEKNKDCLLIKPPKHSKNSHIPYYYSNSWKDNSVLDVKELYNLVNKVRKHYKIKKKKGPIACHCSIGVGRTGTFISAYLIAEMLDFLPPEKISIEEIVLKLSIQRPNMVSVKGQYALLYEFADYYLTQKN
ncbi:MAG: hypothetical protein C5B43_01495 [Verrucomicrobia bacterium]|nr:MAG: hypothetical protein C5B43_01495 [Verrucomicrobiota bacterium]